jgi:hypothetical protein
MRAKANRPSMPIRKSNNEAISCSARVCNPPVNYHDDHNRLIAATCGRATTTAKFLFGGRRRADRTGPTFVQRVSPELAHDFTYRDAATYPELKA